MVTVVVATSDAVVAAKATLVAVVVADHQYQSGMPRHCRKHQHGGRCSSLLACLQRRHQSTPPASRCTLCRARLRSACLGSCTHVFVDQSSMIQGTGKTSARCLLHHRFVPSTHSASRSNTYRSARLLLARRSSTRASSPRYVPAARAPSTQRPCRAEANLEL